MTLPRAQGSSGQPPAFLVFADDWGEHPSSAQHLFRSIAARHPVAWVNTVGMRDPALTRADLARALRKLRKMVRGGRSGARARLPGEPLRVEQPPMLPYAQFALVRRFNARSVGRLLKRLAEQPEFRAPLVVTTVPNAADYIERLSDWPLVYYCVDDFSLWPGVDAPRVRDMEARLIERAQAIIVSSERLQERLVRSNKPIHLITHGVDLPHFAAHSSTEHPVLRGIPRPRAGFFGLIDHRTDQTLLAAVARAMPQLSFVLAGPIEAPLEALARQANVHMTGPVPYAELPELIAGLEVLFIPYRTGPLGDALSPLKLKEYLATGRPIVSTPIAEAKRYSNYVSLAATAEEWVVAITAALQTEARERSGTLASLLESESWERKAERFLEICRAASAGTAESHPRASASAGAGVVVE